MQDLPHLYHVTASSDSSIKPVVNAEDKPSIITGSPKQFGGTGEHWSPEELLLAAIVDCYILSFVAIARISKLAWQNIDCGIDGVLDKVERKTQFTGYTLTTTLTLADDSQAEKAEQLLKKAKDICLVSNSLNAPTELVINIEIAQ